MCFLRLVSSVFAVALLRDLVSPVDPLILCRCIRRQIYFPPRLRHRPLSYTTSWWGIFSLLLLFLVPWPLNSHLVASSQSNVHTNICCHVETWQRGQRTVSLPARALHVYPEPIIFAAVARPSSDIMRQLNQHQLDCLWCTARQNAHIVQLFSPENTIVFPLLRGENVLSRLNARQFVSM